MHINYRRDTRKSIARNYRGKTRNHSIGPYKKAWKKQGSKTFRALEREAMSKVLKGVDDYTFPISKHEGSDNRDLS